MSSEYSSLTTSSVLMCPHGGVVSVAASSPPELRATDAFKVSGCSFGIGGRSHPCTKVKWVQPVAGPLDRTSIGLCLSAQGVPSGPVIIVAA
ncbi:MAG: hypothetical protein DIJKHBIC_04488 [Thermoanaerobaculia bacterium]|nr:hypothetical protein [Thermoanaerobaculia bacterium]